MTNEEILTKLNDILDFTNGTMENVMQKVHSIENMSQDPDIDDECGRIAEEVFELGFIDLNDYKKAYGYQHPYDKRTDNAKAALESLVKIFKDRVSLDERFKRMVIGSEGVN